MPKVLIADKLSPAAVAIFKERGVDADVKTGLTKEELIQIVDQYDGIAVRSATKLTADVLKAARRLKVVGRAGIGVDNVDIPAATAAGVIVMNTPFGNSITTAEHAISRTARRQCLHSGRQVGKEPFHGRGNHRQGAGAYRGG